MPNIHPFNVVSYFQLYYGNFNKFSITSISINVVSSSVISLQRWKHKQNIRPEEKSGVLETVVEPRYFNGWLNDLQKRKKRGSLAACFKDRLLLNGEERSEPPLTNLHRILFAQREFLLYFFFLSTKSLRGFVILLMRIWWYAAGAHARWGQLSVPAFIFFNMLGNLRVFFVF